jgi:hypothetical protein
MMILMALAVAMEMTMTTTFKQSDVIRIVSRLIYESCSRRKDYIGRSELIEAFIADDQGGLLANSSWERYEQKNRHKPKPQWRFQTKIELGGNMIEWFSAHYGRGDAELTSNFERVRMGNY